MASPLQLPRNLRRFADREGTPRPVRSVRLIAQAGVFFPPDLLLLHFAEHQSEELASPCIDARFFTRSRSRDVEDFDAMIDEPSKHFGSGR